MPDKYAINHEIIVRRDEGYVRFWGRKPEVVLSQTDDEAPHIDVYRFPIVDADVPMADCIVYLTGGMSDMDMPESEGCEECFRRSEISAYAPKKQTGTRVARLACKPCLRATGALLASVAANGGLPQCHPFVSFPNDPPSAGQKLGRS